jgi:hypothetical protein
MSDRNCSIRPIGIVVCPIGTVVFGSDCRCSLCPVGSGVLREYCRWFISTCRPVVRASESSSMHVRLAFVVVLQQCELQYKCNSCIPESVRQLQGTFCGFLLGFVKFNEVGTLRRRFVWLLVKYYVPYGACCDVITVTKDWLFSIIPFVL